MRSSISVSPPFRLDVTAALIRRLATTPSAQSDWTNGTFLCSLHLPHGPIVAAITQPDQRTLQIDCEPGPETASDAIQAKAAAILGLAFDMTPVETAAAAIPWLRDVVEQTRGVRPARLASLWEAGVTAIAYQSVSMLAAGAVLNRFVTRLGARAVSPQAGFTLFPTRQATLSASDGELQSLGFSSFKVRAIRAVASAIKTGLWDEAALETLTTPQLCEGLMRAHGIGPWSAAVIALRGFGRLDVFPLQDSGVIRTIDALSNKQPDATADALCLLGETRGMLYHYLLLARLAARGMLHESSYRF